MICWKQAAFSLAAVSLLQLSCVKAQPLPAISQADCGNIKGCFSTPKHCRDPDCDFLLTWQDQGTTVKFELMGKSDGWVAMGLSTDQAMGDDAVTECVSGPDGLSVRNSYNAGHTNALVTGAETQGISATQGGVVDGVVRCEFSKAKVSSNNKIFPLSDPNATHLPKQYYLLIARGKTSDNSTGKLKHEWKFSSTIQVQFFNAPPGNTGNTGTTENTGNTGNRAGCGLKMFIPALLIFLTASL